MSCCIGSNREMFMCTSMRWRLRQDKQTCLRPFTHRHSVSRVEETHHLCTVVTLKSRLQPRWLDSAALVSCWGFFFFPALKQQTKSAWNATWVPESNEPWHSSQKHLLFTTSKSLARAGKQTSTDLLQCNLTTSQKREIRHCATKDARSH